MSTTALRRPVRTGRRLKSATKLLDVNAELRTATVEVDLSEVTEATAPVVAASRLAVNSLMGQIFAERLLGLDVSPARSYLDVAIPDRNPVVVYVSLATEPQRLLKALRSNGVGTLEVDVLVLDDGLAEWAGGEWSGPSVSGGPRNGPSTRLDAGYRFDVRCGIDVEVGWAFMNGETRSPPRAFNPARHDVERRRWATTPRPGCPQRLYLDDRDRPKCRRPIWADPRGDRRFRVAVPPARRGARDSGRLAKEIHPIEIPATRTGRARVFEHDESVRSDTTLEKLASLPAQPNTTQMTAGNSTPLSDGASAVVVASDRAVAELSLDPLARVVSTATYALDPAYMGIAPAWAITAALRRAGLAPPPSTSGGLTRHSPPKPWAYCANWRTTRRLHRSRRQAQPQRRRRGDRAPVRIVRNALRSTLATELRERGVRYGYSECASDPAKAWR